MTLVLVGSILMSMSDHLIRGSSRRQASMMNQYSLVPIWSRLASCMTVDKHGIPGRAISQSPARRVAQGFLLAIAPSSVGHDCPASGEEGQIV